MQEADKFTDNQWQVDFNLAFPSFKLHIQGTRNLIGFSAKTARNAPIYFVSSVSTIQNWDHHGCNVPEPFLHDFKLPVGGYGQSKAIAGLMLEEASKTSSISGAVIRLGQISGPVRSLRGAWNQREWLPTVITSSKFLRCLPQDLATMNTTNWVPVDIMAEILVELALIDEGPRDHSQGVGTMKMFHVVNPQVCQWEDLLPTVREHLGNEFPLVPFEEWVQRLRNSAAAEVINPDANPGIKLLDFFEGMVRDKLSGKESARLETAETERCSKTLRELGPVGVEWMEMWLKQWDIEPDGIELY